MAAALERPLRMRKVGGMNDPITDLVLMVGDAIGGITDAMAKAWDDAADEAYGRGWMHEYAVDDIKGRNPYRSEDAA